MPPDASWEAQPPTIAMKELIARSRRRILLVDDVLDDAEMLAELLRYLGQDATAVGDGAQALAMVSAFAPDVVILDLLMPGLDGFKVAEAIKKIPGLEKTGLFALSGLNDAAVRERCANIGFHRFFSKPIHADLILRGLVEYG